MGKHRAHSAQKDNWVTPTWLFEQVAHEFGPFDLDAAASADNAKCERFFSRDDDGLLQPWTGNVWCNPPYGRGIDKWVQKGFYAARAGMANVTMLLPASTDTAWFHDYCLRGSVKFLRDRIRFSGADRAPFGCMIVAFRKHEKGPP